MYGEHNALDTGDGGSVLESRDKTTIVFLYIYIELTGLLQITHDVLQRAEDVL